MPSPNLPFLPHSALPLLFPSPPLPSHLPFSPSPPSPQCELYHWIAVLDRVDLVMAHGTAYPDGTNEEDQKKILSLCPNLQDPAVSVGVRCGDKST